MRWPTWKGQVSLLGWIVLLWLQCYQPSLLYEHLWVSNSHTHSLSSHTWVSHLNSYILGHLQLGALQGPGNYLSESEYNVSSLSPDFIWLMVLLLRGPSVTDFNILNIMPYLPSSSVWPIPCCSWALLRSIHISVATHFSLCHCHPLFKWGRFVGCQNNWTWFYFIVLN